MSEEKYHDFYPRAELCAHTVFGGDACADPYDLFRRASERSVSAIAVTDTNSIRAYPYAEAAAREFGVKFIHGCELRMMDEEGHVFPVPVVEHFIKAENKHFIKCIHTNIDVRVSDICLVVIPLAYFTDFFSRARMMM